MAAISEKITLGTNNTVQIENIPARQYAIVKIIVNNNEELKIQLPQGIRTFTWDLGFATENFSTIFNKYFYNNKISSVPAKMKVEVYFSTGIINAFRGDTYPISIQLIENSETKPTIDSVTLSPVSDKDIEKYIQGKTKVKCVVEATGKHEATIDAIEVTVDGKSCRKTSEGFVSDWLYNSGKRWINITVTDSRGFKSVTTKDIFVEPYSPPIIVPFRTNPSIICRRWNPNPEMEKFDDTNGTQCKMIFGVYASYIEGVNDSLNCSYKYKIVDYEYVDGDVITQIPFSSSSSQIGVELLIDDGTTTNEEGKIIGCFENEYEYFVELTVTDSLGGTASKTFRLEAIECIYHISNQMFSLGKYATKKRVFDSAWPIHTDKNISADGEIEKLGKPLSVEFGGTGATSLDDAKTKLGINLNGLGVTASANDLNLMKGVSTSNVTTENIKKLAGISSNIEDHFNTLDKHNHDGQYALSGHNHNNAYSLLGHNHSGVYAPNNHNHSGVYAPYVHAHQISEVITAALTTQGSNNIISSTSDGVSFVSDHCWVTKYGKICEIYLTFKYNTSLNEGDIKNINLASLKDEYNPGHYVACHSGGGGIVASGTIADDGSIKLTALGSSYTANDQMSLCATYLLP